MPAPHRAALARAARSPGASCRTLPGIGASSVHNEHMLPFAAVLFLAIAVLLAVGILVVVAMPHLRAPREEDDGSAADHPRHSSRTRRD